MPDKPRILIKMPPPWKNMKVERLSSEQINALTFQQNDDLKWIKKRIIPNFLQYCGKIIDGRINIREKNRFFSSRLIPRTFYNFIPRNSLSIEPILHVYFHEPTFRVFIIHKDALTIITLNSSISNKLNPQHDSVQYFRLKKINTSSKSSFDKDLILIDTAFDKSSGRVFFLFKNWNICIYENGFFSRLFPLPSQILVPNSFLPQKSYIHCDKFGHIWLTISNATSTTYILDPICLSLLKSYQFFLGSKFKPSSIREIWPITLKDKFVGFFATEKNGPALYVLNYKGEQIDKFVHHIKYSPNVYICSSYVITYAPDNKVVFYKRSSMKLQHVKTIQFYSKPLSVLYLKGFSVIMISFADCTIKLFSTLNEVFLVNLPEEYIPKFLYQNISEIFEIGKTTTLFNRYENCASWHTPAPLIHLNFAQFSQTSILISAVLDHDYSYTTSDLPLKYTSLNNRISFFTFWLFRAKYNVRAFSYDVSSFPPVHFDILKHDQKICQTDFDSIFPSICKTRKQLVSDGNFLKQVNFEFQKRFFQATSKTNDFIPAAQLLLLSPYKRLLRFFSYIKEPKDKVISIYELFAMTRHVLIFPPSLNSPESLSIFINSSVPGPSKSLVGPYQAALSSTLTVDDLVNIFKLITRIPKLQLEEYEVFSSSVMKIPTSFISIQLKTIVRSYKDLIILRLNKIANLINNKSQRLFTKTLKFDKKETNTETNLDDITPMSTFKLIQKDKLLPCKKIVPNPIFEAFRYIPYREINISQSHIQYFGCKKHFPVVRIIDNQKDNNINEALMARPMGEREFCLKIIAISNDHHQILQEYPYNMQPLSFILVENPFSSGRPAYLSIARNWFRQILLILSILHDNDITLRTLVPGNILISSDGSSIKLETLADAIFPDADPSLILPLDHLASSQCLSNNFNEKPKNYQKQHSNENNKDSIWFPPEYLNNKKVSDPAFDIYQFGILLVTMLTGFIPQSFAEVAKQYPPEDITTDYFNYDPLKDFPKEQYPFFSLSGGPLSHLTQIESKYSFLDIARACLHPNPKLRPNVHELLSLPLFTPSQSSIFSSRGLVHSIMRNLSSSLTASTIFNTFLTFINEEMNNDIYNVPSLPRALSFIEIFFSRKIASFDFPISPEHFNDIIPLIFTQNFFETIVRFSIFRLQLIFEDNCSLKVKKKSQSNFIQKDESLQCVIKLYQSIIQNKNLHPIMIYHAYLPFFLLCTGIENSNDNYSLFIFLHQKMRNLVEPFLKRVLETPFDKNIDQSLPISSNPVSKFYCENFIYFYDDIRDFAEAFEEHSMQRYANALDFFSSFIRTYPKPDTIRLLAEFEIGHKIEQSISLNNPEVLKSASKLLTLIFETPSFQNPNSDFFLLFFHDSLFYQLPYLLYSDSVMFYSKTLVLSISRCILLSKSIHSIISLLMNNILDSILFCCVPHLEKMKYSVWGENENTPLSEIAKETMSEILNNCIPPLIAIIFSDNDLAKQVVFCKSDNTKIQTSKKISTTITPQNKINNSDSKNSFEGFISFISKMEVYTEILNKIETNGIHPSLISTLQIAECSSMNSISSITKQTEASFEKGLEKIADYLINHNFQPLDSSIKLTVSLTHIWETQGQKFHNALFQNIVNGIRKTKKRNEQITFGRLAIKCMEIIQAHSLPDPFIQIPQLVSNMMIKQYSEIQKLTIGREKTREEIEILKYYKDERELRMNFIKIIITHPDKRLMSELEKTDFAEFLIEKLILNPALFQINYQIMPDSFSKYNHTFPLRSEGISLLKCIYSHRSMCHNFFYDIVYVIRKCNILDKELELLNKFSNNHNFQRSTSKLLKILNSSDDCFGLNAEILNSKLLKTLKINVLQRWEKYNFKNMGQSGFIKKNSVVLRTVHDLYNSII